jgi:HSP20 family molecular chaperone IbpA
MKKTYLTHTLAFCIGAVVAYGLNDYVNLSNERDKRIERRKLRAYDRKKSGPFSNPFNKDKNVDIAAKSFDKVIKNQMRALQKGLSGGVEVEEFETAESYKIVFKGEGLKQDSFQININNGMLLTRMEVVKETKSNWGTSKSVSSFSRSFYIPKDVDASNPIMNSDEKQITIEFKKI